MLAVESLIVLLMAKNVRITDSESRALSIIRVLAMTLIVACHMTQYYGLRIAFLLNVGVQLFFFMSGFLYGKLDMPESPFVFYKKRFLKVYLPYILWTFIIVVVYSVFGLYHVTVKQIFFYLLALQWFTTPIEGLNHLWFLTVLMICYVVTPWVKRLLTKRSPFLFISFLLVCCVVEFLFVKKLYSLCAWISLYVFGLVFGAFYSERFSNIVLIISIGVLMVLGIRFRMNLLDGVESKEYAVWIKWFLGLFLFSALFRCLSKISMPKPKFDLISHLDKYSYDIYLIHHPLILGPLSMMFLTKYSYLNIIVVLLSVYLLSRLFRLICTKVLP